jgi:hypothetical protein
MNDKMKWHKLFDERQLKEIAFSRAYARDYAHGTDGHNAKMIVAKMADLLDELEASQGLPSHIIE